MLLTYFKILLLGLFLLISGCIPILPCDSGFSVDELPEAIENHPYSTKIEILKGAMPNENNIRWEINPKNSGLVINRLFDDNSKFYSGIEIFGKPITQKNIAVRVYGYSYYSQTCTFDKIFIIKVNPHP